MDDTKLMQQQMDASAMMQQMDITKVYTSERENLELCTHTWVGDEVDDRVMGKKKASLSQKKDL